MTDVLQQYNAAIVRKLEETNAGLARSAARHACLAELSQLALASGDEAALMGQAVHRVAQSLGADCCGCWEVLLRAGVGWPDGAVGTARVGGGREESQAGFTLCSGQPVAVESAAAETRFSPAELLLAQSAASGASVVIPETRGRRGVLSVHSWTPRTFEAEEIHFLQSVANLLAAASGRRRTEEDLRESEERLRLAQQGGGVGIFDRDLRTRRSVWNDVLYRIYGLDPAEAATPPDQWGERVHPEDQAELQERLSRALAAGATQVDAEHRILRADGQVRWISTRSQVAYDAVGRPVRMLGAILDVTERRQAEEALRQLNSELEERVRERTVELEERAGQLARLTAQLTQVEQRERRRLAHVLHDHLQQLLVGATYGLEVLARRIGPAEQAHVKHVRGLLTESLQVSRSLTVELSPPILHEAGLGAGLEWLSRWMQEKHGLHVAVQAHAPAEPEREDVRALLFEAARELLLNVVKHAGVGEARVELGTADPDQTVLSVSDRGRGFDPGVIAGRSRSSGFGLFSIRERAALLGGRLGVESAPGQGARLWLAVPRAGALPQAAQAAGAGEARALTTPPPGSAPWDGRPALRLRILLADDHAVVRQGLVLLLGTEGDMEVVGEASCGEEAVAQSRRLRPDVVLMDLSMPGMDGLEATRRIVAELPEVRIVGLSMFPEADRAAAMRQAGAVAYLAKSGQPQSLLSAIRSACRQAPDAGPTASQAGGR
ncbi:MAG: response regulator [Candidatus Latescibacterota bacterium]